MKYLQYFKESLDQSILKETFNFLNMDEAIIFIRKACDIFEKSDHHPDFFCLKGKQLEIHLTTHSEGGVTDKDINVMNMLKDSISDCCKPLNPNMFK
jgi:4a-hydroxytetrahydrobiopterin dehydratase